MDLLLMMCLGSLAFSAPEVGLTSLTLLDSPSHVGWAITALHLQLSLVNLLTVLLKLLRNNYPSLPSQSGIKNCIKRRVTVYHSLISWNLLHATEKAHSRYFCIIGRGYDECEGFPDVCGLYDGIKMTVVCMHHVSLKNPTKLQEQMQTTSELCHQNIL